MVAVVPCPDPSARPINDPETVELAPGEQATVTYEPDKRVTEVRFPTVAISKDKHTTYRIRVDSDDKFGPADVPPTDVDDLGPTFLPALTMRRELVIEVTRLSSATGSVTYTVQPVGWEATDGGA